MSNIRIIKHNHKIPSFLSSFQNKNISEKKNKKKEGKIFKGDLKGKLFRLINHSILLSEEKYIKLKEDIDNNKYSAFFKKKLDKKNKVKRPFNYFAQYKNIINSPKKTMKFEDEYISPNELFEKKLTAKENQIILSAPYHYGLNYGMLKELNIFTPKNLTEVLDKEEKNEQLYTLQTQKTKSLYSSYYNSLKENDKESNNKLAKTSFNTYFPRLKTIKKNKNKNLFKNTLSLTNDNSLYYNTYSNMNTNKNIFSPYNTNKNNNNNYMSFLNINDLKLINHYKKMMELQNDFSNKIKMKTIIDEEKHIKYKMRKTEINEYNKKKLINQSIINHKRQIKSQNEKQRIIKEKIFIDNCLNILKNNYKEKSKNSDICKI